MEVRTFRARSTTQAMRSIKDELGAEAVILGTRTLPSGLVEVDAGPGHLSLVPGELGEPTHREPPPPVPDLSRELESVRSLLRGFLREADASRRHGLPTAASPTFVGLVDAGVGEGFGLALRRDVVRNHPDADETEIRDATRAALAAATRCAGPLEEKPLERQVVALLGPTGVGKTTTLSKLAAGMVLREGKRVGLIAADAGRLGAIEQVRRYAEILDVPFAVALTREGLRDALTQMRTLDTVLIDTGGRSPRDEAELEALQALFDRPPCKIERHLCLAAVAKERDNIDAAERFRRVGFQRLLFTKLDETQTYGGLYAVARAVRRPLSYLATGPRIPDDLEVARAETVAEMILPKEEDADVARS